MIDKQAAKILSKRRKINKPWMSDDILNVCDTLKKRRREATEVVWQYSCVDISRKSRTKENFFNEQCEIINSCLSKGNNKTAFDTIRRLLKSQQARINVSED